MWLLSNRIRRQIAVHSLGTLDYRQQFGQGSECNCSC
uniref:Uncharacterized protein n=1 Tax=Arundo donax TaxID=35708 RepID=A0A0A9EPR2_ARUDO